jgi:hypothetical protein
MRYWVTESEREYDFEIMEKMIITLLYYFTNLLESYCNSKNRFDAIAILNLALIYNIIKARLRTSCLCMRGTARRHAYDWGTSETITAP